MYKFYLLLLCAFVASTFTYAQEKPYSIGNSANVLSNFRRQLTTVKPNGSNRLQLALPSTRSLQAVINYRKSSGTTSEQLGGSIANVPNSSFYLRIENKSVQGHILLRDSKKAYTYSSDNNGTVFVQETDINKIICVDFEKGPESAAASVAVANAATATSAAGFYDQQSYPQGKGCVLLDFDGEIVTGTFWNNSIPDGASINAAPANISDADKQQTWESVSESFRFLSLNITTSEAVFNTYPVNKRVRCIFTPTNVVAPGAGGVAYIGSFSWSIDNPCWVFMNSGKRISDAAAHEIGHTLNLFHDGRPGEAYYRGHGYWAPIMGVGYDKSLVQWSKGEYANANNKEDDLQIMSGTMNDVGYRADDYGNTTTDATLLTMNAAGNVSSRGVIERTADVDMFSFTTASGPVNLTFKPNVYYPALDILATLYDNKGTVITTSDSAGLNAGISTTLAAGTYYVSVTGTGFGNPENTGYSNYGSLGTYNITGTIPIQAAADTVAGRCLKMDGSSTEISLGKVPINSNNFSISCWIKPDGLQKSFSQIIGWNPAPALGKGLGIGFTFNRYIPNLQLIYTDTIVGWGAGASGHFADTATWNFVVLTYSPTGVRMYLNGEPAIVNNGAMPVLNLSQHPFYVNRDIHYQFGAYKGAVDEIKFYNYALSQNEVREKMHLIQSNATAETGLLKYFQFNQYDSATGTVPDLMSDFKATIPNGSFIVPSTAPVATGTVFLKSFLNFKGGQFSFPGTGVDIFLKNGFYAWGDVAVFRLNSSPDKQPDSLSPVPKSQYFIINSYGAPITNPDSIRFSGLNIAAGYQATDFRMYSRHSGGWGNTWGTQVSRSTGFNYAPGSSSITFGPGNNITRYGQFALSAPVTPQPSLAAARVAEAPPPALVSTTAAFYPNPTKGWGYLNITSPNTNGRVMVSLQDMNGNVVYQASEPLPGGGKTSLLLMFNAPSSGIYILNIRFSNGEVITKKVVIVK